MIRRLAASLALFALGSVHAQAEPGKPYPSLAKRAAESRDRTPPPAPPPVVPAAPDPALVAQVDTLSRQSDSGEAAFQLQLAQGRSAVTAAGSAAPASEAWVTAQIAISALDSARYDSVSALAGLDTLYVERQDNLDAGRVQADLAAIVPVRERALARVDAQNDALDSLRRTLRLP